MKKGKKINLVVMSLLGTGILLGSSCSKALAYDQELIISGGASESQDQIGMPNEDNHVEIDQSSTWTGNMTVSNSGTSLVEMSQTSLWSGDLTVDTGSGTVVMDNSTWRGDVNVSGDSILGDATINLTNSSLVGDVKVTNGYSDVSLGDHSTWEGDYLLTANSESYAAGHVSVTDYSSWKGDAAISLQNTEQTGNFNTNIDGNSEWQGNIRLDASDEVQNLGVNTYIGAYENSRWIGNADVNGAFRASLGMGSQWIGNAKIESGEISQSSGGGYVSIYDSSSWQGSMEVTHMNQEYMTSMYVNLGQNSQWNGDVKATGNVTVSVSIYDNSVWKGNWELNFQNADPDYISQTNIDMGEASQWIGNLKVAGNVGTHAYLYGNSSWIGDLDISQNTLAEEYDERGVGEISLSDHSTWQGKVISGNSRGIAVNMENESSWNITDTSKLAALSINDSGISFVPKGNGTFSTLTVDGNFDSNNTLYTMNTDFARNQGDLLVINGEISGENNLIQVNNQGDAWVDPEQELAIIKTQEGADADYFTLNHAVEVGGFEYGMKQFGNDWVLYSDDRRPTQPAQAGIKLFEGSYLLNYAGTQTLMQRMGDLRNSEDSQGIWARVYGGKFTSSSRGFLDGYKMNYTGLQVGRDKKFDLGENKGDIYVGGMFGYGKGSLDYGVGSGNVDSKTLGLYGTYVHPSGFYADAVLKYNRMNNDYKVLDSAGTPVKGDDINTDGVHFSLEVGQRIHLDRQAKSGWYVEPQAQISVGRVSSGDFTASNGLRVHVDDYNTVLGRVGMLAGYEVKGGNNPINVYGKVSYVHEFNGDMGYRFNGISVNDSFGDSWIVYGVGASAQLGKSHNLYLDIERASGGQFNQPWAINGGYRFTW